MKKIYLECGRVSSAHGVRGIMKIEPWCDSPRVLASQKRVFTAEKDGAYKEHRITSASQAGSLVLMGIEGISTREDASAMKNIVLYLHRDDIPVAEGEMLIQDMIGLPVIDYNDGTVYGEITDIYDGAASKIYTIKTKKGDVLFPAVSEFVKEINEERGVLVTPIPGFFDDEI